MMKIYDIGSARLAYQIYGAGERTFVIDTALGTCSAEWWHIAEFLGKNSRVLVYDRAGYGKSSVSKLERTPDNIASELKKLLESLHIEKNIILVGHSQGGLYAVQFAIMFPNTVEGLILLDPATPFDSEFKETLSAKEYRQSGVDKTASLKIGKVITSVGLGFVVKPLLRKSPPFYYHEFPPEAREYLLRSLCSKNTYKTALAEYAFSHDDVHTKAISEAVSGSVLKDLPIRLITHSSDFYIKELEQYGGMDTKTAEKVEALWQNIMAKFLRLSQCSEHISAPNSGHYIHLTDQELLLSTAESFITDRGL
jgi:pimeloyl-ACP methyl ester carboxylesterase